MGIQSLLPFLANSAKDAHISEFEYEFVAVDGYCWLHKGIYSCASELAMKKPTDKYVKYCMRYIDMLLFFKVKPIMVFDGRQLSSKSDTEKKRREERKKKYEKGKELMRAGKINEGRKLLEQSVDVTHELALNLIRECRRKNIDCIVAPYEADAQLAFFSIRNIVKCIITEDSDLLAYGCERVMFKMDTSGKGKLIEKSEIHLSLNITEEEFNEDIFRYMCILSGCDYLPSLPSIGPAFALKFIKMLKGNDIYEALPRLPIYVNKLNVKISNDYLARFRIADNTFKHQLVYDPFQRTQVPLRQAKNDDDIVGEKLSDDLAFQLAVGNIDPNTMNKVDNFDPDKICSGFDILWRTDLLPEAIPRQLFFTRQTIPEAKKRLREHLESDAVQSISSDIKKQRIPLSTKSNKHFSVKNSNQKVPESGFIFYPKILNEKKNTSKFVDKPRLLRSRYFSWNMSEGQNKKPTEDFNDKRKDESHEDYLQRLYNEYFPINENEFEESKERKEKCCCGLQTEISVTEKFCSACEKCFGCCNCRQDLEVSENKQLNKYNKNVDDIKKFRQKSQYCLFDELYKNHSESDNRDLLKEDVENIENEEKEEKSKVSLSESWNANCARMLSKFSVETDNCATETVAKENSEVICDNEKEENSKVSLSESWNANFATMLSKFSIETDNCVTETVAKENSEVICHDDQESIRSHSPVFKIQRETKNLNKNFRLGNISNTTGTPTSVYFSSNSNESLIETNFKVSSKSTQKSSHEKVPLVRRYNSLPAKAGKTDLKNFPANRTLFQFGFKKQRRNENAMEMQL